jgi:hypothetical protein
LFKTFYADVRLQILCKDSTKILPQRIFEMNEQLYMLQLIVERGSGSTSDGHDPDDGLGDENEVFEPPANNMETDNHGAPHAPAAPPPTSTASGSFTSLPGHNSAALYGKIGDSQSCMGRSEANKIVSSPTRSLHARLEYGLLDDGVWDWEGPFLKPDHIEVDEVENVALYQLGENKRNPKNKRTGAVVASTGARRQGTAADASAMSVLELEDLGADYLEELLTVGFEAVIYSLLP